MIKICYQFIIKNIKKSLSVLASIILSIALLVGIGSLIYSANISKSEYYANISGNYQYVYHLSSNKQLKLAESAKKTNKNIINIGITENLYFTDEPKVISVIGCNKEFLEMNKINLLEGKLPENNHQIAIEEWVAKNLNLKEIIGNTLTINRIKFEIVGLLSDSFEKYNKSLKVYTTLNTQFRTKRNYNMFVNFNISSNIEEESLKLMNYLKCKKKDRGANWDVVEALGIKPPTDTKITLSSIIQNFKLDENTVVVLFGIFSAFIIYSILGVSIIQRLPQYGVLETLGASYFTLFKIIFYEIFGLYLIGFPIGCILGILGAKLLYSNFSHIFLGIEIESSIFLISQKTIIKGFLFLSILLFIISWRTVCLLRKQTTIETLKNRNTSLVKKRKILSVGKISLLNIISHRYMTSKKGIFISTILSLSIGGIIFLCSIYSINETRNQNNLSMKADDGLNSDYVINMETTEFNVGLSGYNIEQLKKINGISSISPVKHFIGESIITSDQYTNKTFFYDANSIKQLNKYFNGICTEKNNNYYIKGNIYGYDEIMLNNLKDYIIEGTIDITEMENYNSIIVCLPEDGGTGEYNTIDIHPGDILPIKVPKTIDVTEEMIKFDKDHEEWYDIKEFKVIATVKRVMAHNDYFFGPYGLDIIMKNECMEREFHINNYNIVSIKKQEKGYKVSEKIQEITSSIDRCNFMDYTTLIEKANINLRQRELFFIGLSCIILFISMLHIINSMNYVIISRKQDFGIMRALGLNNFAFLKMMLKESIIYGILADLIMGIGSIIIINLIYYYIRIVGLYISPRLYINWKLLIIYSFINILLSISAVILPVRTILKEEIIDGIEKIE